MKHCQQCNLDYPEDFIFCLSCGNPLGEKPATKKPPQQTLSREAFISCSRCGNLVRTNARFCEHCGTGLGDVESLVASRPEPPPTQYVQPPQWQPSSDVSQRTPEDSSGFRSEVPPPRVAAPTSPVRNDQTTPSLSGYQPYSGVAAAPRSGFRLWHALVILVFFLGLIGLLGAGGWWWWSSQNSTTKVNDNSNQSQTDFETPSASPGESASPVTSNSADAELERLQQRVSEASPSDREILTSIGDAEEKYPADYRFTYERSKLFGKGMISHDEAWDALYQAAEKAIDNHKAAEMSSDMTAKADGDFKRLSRGHTDWSVIIQALDNNDKAALKRHVH